jgi:hypothetical protein
MAETFSGVFLLAIALVVSRKTKVIE